MLNNREQAYQLLRELGACSRLITHLKLVGEAGDIICQTYQQMGIEFNEGLVKIGISIHDAGKILYPEELSNFASNHEPAGEKLLLEHGVQPEIARCCITHAKWQDTSFEEQTIALADKLWKGKREEVLELTIIDQIAKKLGLERWDVFTQLDTVFESIAEGGWERIQRSR